MMDDRVKKTAGSSLVPKPEQAKLLLRRHVKGAYIRSGASAAMWFMALSGYYAHILKRENLLGISISVVFLVLMNFPTLWILRRIRRKSLYEAFSILINALDVAAFTGIIYSVGGIHDMVLCLTLAALIAYLGVLAPPRVPFIIASFSALCLSSMVFLEYNGIIPSLYPHPIEPISLGTQVLRLFCAVGLLFVVTFIASYAGSVMRRQQEKLRGQNLDLENSRRMLGEATEAMREKNVELRVALEGARSSDRAKSEFLANMSHELRTPLNHIMGFTGLILERHCGDLNRTQEEYLRNVLESSGHLLSLINDILDLSKVEAGKLELEIKELRIRDLLESSLGMVRELAQKQGTSVKAELDGVPDIILADERRLRQVLYNLLSNALKFTPKSGEILLSATFESGLSNADREVGAPGWLQISVSDTGIGLKKEDLERIFKPFEQGENSASRRYQGTGLGLSLTRRLVELHGGRIWAESEGEGKGSCFRVVLPIRPKQVVTAIHP